MGLDLLAFYLAGSTGSGGNPLLADFLIVGQKLEKLGFTYYKGRVTITSPSEIV